MAGPWQPSSMGTLLVVSPPRATMAHNAVHDRTDEDGRATVVVLPRIVIVVLCSRCHLPSIVVASFCYMWQIKRLQSRASDSVLKEETVVIVETIAGDIVDALKVCALHFITPKYK
ncbi:hypothetical protein ACLOJK_010751 [Asimina triloba]